MSKTAQEMWEEYQQGLAYQSQMQMITKYPMYERFRMGDQWPEPTDRTKHLPRPVINIIDMFIRTKRSAVLEGTLKLIYTPSEADTEDRARATAAAKDYTDYAAQLWRKLRMDDLLKQYVDDAAAYGTGFAHFYWDEKAEGGMTLKYKGDIGAEIIDSLNIFFGNPQEQEIQEQPYIIISSRMDIETVKELARANGTSEADITLIAEDKNTSKEGYDAAQKESTEQKKTTVLTRYYKNENGEVFFSKSTESVLIVDGQSLTPRVEVQETEITIPASEVAGIKPIIEGAIQGEEITKAELPEGAEMEQATEVIEPAVITLYPLELIRWNLRKKTIYGTGEIEGIIPNQKMINQNYAFMAYSIQNHAWPRIIRKQGANQNPLTNMPGEIYDDTYIGGGDGIKYMQPPVMSTLPINFNDALLSVTRVAQGVTEISTGEQQYAGQAASAIIALQAQARGPINEQQRGLYRSIEGMGKIWEQFFKTYYKIARNVTTGEGEDIETRQFTGTDYADIEMNMNVDVGPASSYSEALAMQTLEMLFSKGDITVEQFIRYAPLAAVPFRTQLLEEMQPEEQVLPELPSGIPPEMMQGIPQAPQVELDPALMQILQGGIGI